MDWKILIGVILFLLTFAIYQQCSSDRAPDYDKTLAAERAARQNEYNETQRVQAQEQRAQSEAAARHARGKQPPEQLITLSTPEFSAQLTTLGAALKSYTLHTEQYLEHPRNWTTGTRDEDAPLTPINLVTTNPKERFWAAYPLRFEVYEGLDGLLLDGQYEVVSATPERAVFRYAQPGQPVVITRKFEIDEKTPYQIWVTTRIHNTSAQRISFRPGMVQAGYQHDSEQKGGFLSREPNLMKSICHASGEMFQEPHKEMKAPFSGTDVRFAGVSTNYFLSVMIPGDDYPTTCLAKADVSGIVRTDLQWGEMKLDPGQSVTLRVQSFMGPKQHQRLQAMGHHLQDSVDYGFFAPISRILLWLMFIFQGWVVNWGLAIVLLTVTVKVLLIPLTHKSFASAAAMRALKPEMDRINEKYKDSPEEKQRAILEMYKQRKVNPFGGCLPMLLQMPIWFALFRTLRASPELYRAPFFGWITDLSSPDPYYITPVVMGALMFLQQRMMPVTQDNAQAKMMLYMMPIMFTGMMLFLPSGLTLYILVNTVLSILHQLVLHRSQENAASKRA
ncbi:MAG: membrane protein insertase YidC [Myxococcales bacterium]|nr:membrane protein insertase YidC [Myxococcales bacterium]